MTDRTTSEADPAASAAATTHGLEPTDGPLTFDELQLAARNRGMPLEALRYDITPTGLHYLLIHWDIPAVDPAAWRLRLGGRVARPLELSLRGAPGTAAPIAAGHARVRRQRPGAVHAPAAEPALAARGGQHG